MSAIQSAQSKGYISSDDLLADLLSNPACFSLTPKNTHIRCIEAHIAPKKMNLSKFFKGAGRNKKDIEKNVIAHYTESFNRTGKGIKTLRRMHQAGLISELPKLAA